MFKNPFASPGNSLPDYASTKEQPNPFQKAGQVWDERIGEPVIRARNWQINSGMIGVALILVSATLLYREVYAPLPAYGIPVDRDNVTVGGGYPIANARYIPNEAQVRKDLADWIVNIRSRPMDGYQLQQNLLRAQAFMDNDGIKLWNGYKKKADPFKDYKQSKDQTSKVTITVTGPNDNGKSDTLSLPVVSPLGEKGSFSGTWKEVRWENGIPGEPYLVRAVIHAKAKGQTKEELMTINPAGTNISWWEWRAESISK